ncbi:MAG: ABC transporter ATP-binding protein [Dehalococcoidales bacterium]|jgi:ABC-2 type transport system ATP-binding protein|nr:ABC transporter ATP-binding protein [Dehalococcoidales bacterium]MDP6576390.1 ABC transporter ATP-binding protein [Dehalococcoidales bacterium]MDP6824983.1 ABC transporter ATP-binding protein [Dehalococcoidales bacterium]
MSEKLTIETQDLTKRYNGAAVVDCLNLHIEENVIFGLLGPNGAGKTTTILMLLGLTEPTSGTAQVCGFNPTREPLQVKRLVGYLPEKVGFYEDLTARENLRFIAELNNINYADINRQVDEVLEMVGLTDTEIIEVTGPDQQQEKTVGKFSRGMKQRLGIADVLIKKPKVLFLDEPTSGLDPKGINQLLDLIADLPKRGTTVVLSSHQLSQVNRVCHSIGILSKGKIVEEGTIDQLNRATRSGGQQRIKVETVSPDEKLTTAIRKIKGVRDVTIQENLLLISTDIDTGVQLAISQTVVQHNFPLLQMSVEQFSLDDIYMKHFKEN